MRAIRAKAKAATSGLCFLILALPCHGQEDPAARSLAATCAGCHGTEGRSVTKEVAPLAGMAQASLAASMRAFRDGTRAGTVMPQIAKGYNDRQIDLIAGYFARKAP
ncbi:MAG TPA: c-type cytochrome [Burkholderiales bacterium]